MTRQLCVPSRACINQVFIHNYLKISWNVRYEVQSDTGPCIGDILWLDLTWHFLGLGYDFDTLWHECVFIQYDLSCYIFLFEHQPVFGCKYVQRDRTASVPFIVVKTMAIHHEVFSHYSWLKQLNVSIYCLWEYILTSLRAPFGNIY